MGAEIDRLEVAVETSASKANAELNKLINRLDKVAGSLQHINTSGLTGFANGIEKLSKSMQAVNSVKTSDFTRLVNNIQKVSQIDSSGLNRTASALNTISKSLNNTGVAASSSQNIVAMAGNLGKLGGVNIEKAISNLPKLASELKNLMTILAQSPNVSKNVIQMTNALANLSNSLKGIRTNNVSSSATKSKSSVQRLSNAFSNLSANVTRSSKSMSGFSQFVGKFYAIYLMTIRGLKKIGRAIESSMDYVETYNYFSVTMDKVGREFGNMYEKYGYDSAEAYVESFSGRLNELTRKMTGYQVGSSGELSVTDSVGLALDPEEIMNFQSSISAVTNSVGLIGENSINASKALTMLSADMSSLKNVDLSTAMTNFQSGLIGQSRALYKYGIDITNATLQTYAYDLGLSKSVSEMTQAEKMQLRMIAILDQSKVAWGDQARTINSVANQYRIMKQQISNLARVIGNLFLPIVQKVLPVVNGLIIAIQKLFTALGFQLWGGNWLKDAMDGISGGGASDDVFDGLEEDADDYADSLGAADKAAKKLSATLLGFDQINKLTDNDTSSSSESDTGSGGNIDLSDAIGAALADYESVWDEAMANSKNKAQEYADAITATFTRIWKAIEPFRESVNRLWNEGLNLLMGYSFQNLKDFYNEFLVPIGTWAFGTEGAGITRLADVINNQLMRIDWPWMTKNLKEFWQAIEPYAEQFGEGLIDFFDDISGIAVDGINLLFGKDGAINGITDWLNNNDPENARRWGRALGELATALLAFKGISKIGGTLKGVAEGLLAFGGLSGMNITIPNLGLALSQIGFTGLGTASFYVIGNNILDGISSIIAELIPDWAYDLLSKMGAGLVVGVAGGAFAGPGGMIAGGIIGIVGGAIWSLWDEIVAWWDSSIGAWWTDKVTPWFTKEKWSELFGNIKQSLKEKWDETVGQWISDVSKWWNVNVEPWFSKETWTLDGIETGLSQAFDNAIASMKDIWNKFAEWLNDKLEFSWDSFEIAGKEIIPSGYLSLGHIPTFAQGGYPETGQLFMARENGINEMIGRIGSRSAVANNDQIVEAVSIGVADAVANVMMAFMNQNNANSAPVIENIFKVDSEVMYRSVQKGKEKYDRRYHVMAEIQ